MIQIPVYRAEKSKLNGGVCMSDMIFAVITGIISVILFIYVSFTVRGKGIILSNTYLFASKEERDKIDKEAEYHLVSVVFGILAAILAFLTAYIITSREICLYRVFTLCVCDIVYAVKESIKSEKNK